MHSSANRLAAFVLFVTPVGASAQSDYGGGWAVPSLDVSQSIIRDVINRRMHDDLVLGRNRAGAGDDTNPAAKAPSGQASLAVAAARLNFVASPLRRNRNYSRFIAQSRSTNPGAATYYDQMFTSNRYLDRLDGALQAKGLKSNSIADAFAAYWTSTWLASRGRNSPVSVAQAQATRSMAIQILSNTPSLASMSDTAKQEIADEFFIKAGLMDGLMAASANDPSARKTIAQVARQGGLQWGLDLDAMELGPNGFEFAR